MGVGLRAWVRVTLGALLAVGWLACGDETPVGEGDPPGGSDVRGGGGEGSACVSARDCGRGLVCDEGRCARGCGGALCTDPTPYCDGVAERCVACTQDGHCAVGAACVAGACEACGDAGCGAEDVRADADDALSCLDPEGCEDVVEPGEDEFCEPCRNRCEGDDVLLCTPTDRPGCFRFERLSCRGDGGTCRETMGIASCSRVCQTEADCLAGDVCFMETCVPGCARDEDCRAYESDACSVGVCEGGYCFVEPLMERRDAPDDIGGDCRRPVCDRGRVVYVTDDTDSPPPSVLACVESRCEDGLPVVRARNELCAANEICSVRDGGCVDRDEVSSGVCVPNGADPTFTPTCGDGIGDEGCACDFGAVQRCYTGPPHTRGVGQCADGYQTCLNQANPRWGPCLGSILPLAQETCDGRDNTCNGCADDGLVNCAEGLSCPDDETVQPLRWHTLDARRFFDGAITNIRWTVTPPENSNAGRPENPNIPQTRFYVDVSGDYLVQVQIIDDKGTTLGCAWRVTARGPGLRVELVWDTFRQVDMDLHLLRDVPGASFCTSNDCYYANCVRGGVNWGYPDSPSTACGRARCPNPRLDIDNISGSDPENINVDNPNDGDSFRVMVHMYSGSRLTNPVVSIYCGGGLSAVFGRAPDQVRMTQSGGSCRGHTWRVADVVMRVHPGTGATTCDVNFLPGSFNGYDVRTNTAAR